MLRQLQVVALRGGKDRGGLFKLSRWYYSFMRELKNDKGKRYSTVSVLKRWHVHVKGQPLYAIVGESVARELLEALAF